MIKNVFFFGFFLFFGVDTACASGGIAELTSGMQMLLDTIRGPFAQVILIFMLILTGIGYWFSRGEEISGFIKNLLGVVFIMTFVALATSIVTTLFPSVSGALLA